MSKPLSADLYFIFDHENCLNLKLSAPETEVTENSTDSRDDLEELIMELETFE